MGNEASAARKLDQTLFDVRLASKSLERQSRKCESKQRKQEKKVVAALKANDMERAKIYAENAIREKKQALNLLRMSSRMDAVASRIQSAQATRALTPVMERVTKEMGTVLKTVNTGELSATMDRFDKVCEDLDVTTAVMEHGISGATTTATAEDQVQQLLEQVADQAGLDLDAALAASGEVPVGTGVAAPATATPAAARLEAALAR